MLYCPLGVNITMVFAASLASIVFGSVWYAGLFGKAWREGLGKTQEQLGNPWIGLAVMAVCTLIAAVALDLLVLFLNIRSVSGGIKLGLLTGLGLVATSIIVSDTYEKRPLKLTLINAGYQVGSITILAALLARFR